MSTAARDGYIFGGRGGPLGKGTTMHADARRKAEAFIDKVIAPARARPAPDPKIAKARTELDRKELELARRELVAGGLGPDRLDKLASERAKDRRKLADQAHRIAVEGSAAAALRLKDFAPVILPFEPMDTIIDQVTFIRSFAGQGTVLESNIAPMENWARYRLDSTSDSWDGTGRLSFFILWKNEHDSPTVLTAKPNLVINAHLSCNGDWSGVASWFGMSSKADGKVRVRTTVWGMDSNVKSVVHEEEVAEVSVDGGFFGDDSSTSIEFNEVLPAFGVVVPGQTFVLIEVEVLTDWSANTDASVTLDAESGSHRVDLPQIVLSTDDVQPPAPPITLNAGVDHFTTPPSVLLLWTGATGAQVDLYQDGVRTGNTLNDGAWRGQFNPGTYTFRICETNSSVCSANVTVTVT
jgi:hypothetical protein